MSSDVARGRRRFSEASRQEREVDMREVKMAVGREGKTGNVTISYQEH